MYQVGPVEQLYVIGGPAPAHTTSHGIQTNASLAPRPSLARYNALYKV